MGVLSLKEALDKLLPAVKKTRDLPVNAEKNARSAEMKLSLIKH